MVGSSIDFSISHSGTWVVEAIADSAAVGVDVAADASQAAELHAAALAPGEYPCDDEQFTRIWVRKEAVIKAFGTGMRTQPGSFAVSAATEPAALVSWPGA